MIYQTCADLRVACSLLKIAFIVCTETEAFIAKLRKRQSLRAVDVVVIVVVVVVVLDVVIVVAVGRR